MPLFSGSIYCSGANCQKPRQQLIRLRTYKESGDVYQNAQRQRKPGQVTRLSNVPKHRGIYLLKYQKEKIYKHSL